MLFGSTKMKAKKNPDNIQLEGQHRVKCEHCASQPKRTIQCQDTLENTMDQSEDDICHTQNYQATKNKSDQRSP